jgi:hypothetical protein
VKVSSRPPSDTDPHCLVDLVYKNNILDYFQYNIITNFEKQRVSNRK